MPFETVMNEDKLNSDNENVDLDDSQIIQNAKIKIQLDKE